jgi:hypothetical protein
MLIRAYCADGHERTEFLPRPENQVFWCRECTAVITREAIYQSVPQMYQELMKNDFGMVLAAFADIGAIDLIFQGKYPLKVEYAREQDLNLP